MRIAYLVPTIYDLGGTASAVVTQANALAQHHQVEIFSVYRDADLPGATISPAVTVHDVVAGIDSERAARLRGRPPLLVPPQWDPNIDALADVGLEAVLPQIEADVVVTVTPVLLALATQLVPVRTAVVHQEHRSSSQRTHGMDALLAFAPRADVLAMLTEPMAAWVADRLGPRAPEIVVMPNALPPGYRPRSMLDAPLIVAAGRLAGEKQYPQLISAFGQIAEQIPDWRLRIFGEGPARFELMGVTRKLGLWDRVELPGPTSDLASEWATASISALTSRAEGFPLVILEAMAAGVPVVSYDCPSGPREIIDDGVDGLLVAQSSEPALAAALLSLASDPQLRTRLGAAAIEKAASFDSAVITERWLEIFEAASTRRQAAATGRSTARLTEATAVSPAPPDQAPAGAEGLGVTPAEARSAALAAVTTAAAEVSSEAFLVPPHGPGPAVVVVPMEARRAFLEALAAASPPAYLSLRDPENRGWPERRGTPASMVEHLRRGRTGELFVEPWPLVDGEASLLGVGCGVSVQFWEEGLDGDLHTTRAPTYAVQVPRAGATATAVVEGLTVATHPVMVGPTSTECTFPIDVVYTWVDGSDPVWDQARQRRLAEASDERVRERSVSGRARFTDRDELRYSMRSIHLFAPWVRRIHLVTAGQVPDWLDPQDPLIQLVDHRQILPESALPTFNSHAIEAALHRVPDLAEHFLYLNDDMFLGRPSHPERWFGPAGQTAFFPSTGVVGLPGQDDLPYLWAAANNRRLIQETFGVTTAHTLQHTPYPHRRSVLDEISARFADEVDATVHAPFRSPTDVSMASSLAQHYGMATGSAYVGQVANAFVNISDADVNRRLGELLARDRDSFCLGDSHDFARDPEQVAAMVQDWLAGYFPIAAPWERVSR